MNNQNKESNQINHFSGSLSVFRGRIGDHIIQGVIIFASVLLAFYLNDLRETKNNQEVIDNGLQNIATEMSYNHKQMSKSFTYYHSVLNVLDSLQKNHPEEVANLDIIQLPQWRGLQLPMLRSTAYHTLFNAGVTRDIPIDLTNVLAQIYNFQTVIERFDDAIIASAAQNQNLVSFESIFFFFGSYAEIIPELLAWYQTLGKRYLEKYGYNLEIEDEILRKTVRHYEVYIN